MLWLVAVVGGTVGVWFLARWLGRGKPCPATVAAFFDNRFTERFSGTALLVERAEVRPGMRVLDAGCGPGRLTIPLARRVGAAGHVVALDVQEAMLERVKRNVVRSGMANVVAVRGALENNAAALRGQREAFDRILLVTVLGEIPDKNGALRSLHAALKPGGVLSITETIIDPDYVSRSRVRELATSAGFAFDQQYGSAIAFTMNFRRTS